MRHQSVWQMLQRVHLFPISTSLIFRRMNVIMYIVQQFPHSPQILTLAKSLEASPLPRLLSASSAQPALPFYNRQERKIQIRSVNKQKVVTKMFREDEVSSCHTSLPMSLSKVTRLSIILEFYLYWMVTLKMALTYLNNVCHFKFKVQQLYLSHLKYKACILIQLLASLLINVSDVVL